jgi:DNA-binding transcriptional LysR family regulator
LLPGVLKAFRAQFPEIQLSLQELTTSQQIAHLRNDPIRVGFLRPPIGAPDIETEIILREPWLVAMPESHPLKARSIIALSELAPEPFIGTPRSLGPGLYDQVFGLCLQAGFSPRVVQEAIQMQTVVSLVSAGLGVALVPESMRKLSSAGVLYKRLRGSPTVQMALAWRRGVQSPVLQSFVSVVRATCGGSRGRDAKRSANPRSS